VKETEGIMCGRNWFGAAIVALVAAGPANAGPLDISNITGAWMNPVGGANVAGAGSASISWGDSAAPDSGYLFVPGGDIVSAPLATPLFLGDFTHENEPIPSGTGIAGVDLNFGFDTNGAPLLVAAVFAFAHDETPNVGGSPMSDDIVTIVTPIVNIPITVGADVYFFNLLGFSQDGGVTFNNVFSSPEGGSNSAQLFGQITASPVPEPGMLVLFGVGLASVAGALRRRQRVAVRA
jgi:hypothetical protein